MAYFYRNIGLKSTFFYNYYYLNHHWFKIKT